MHLHYGFRSQTRPPRPNTPKLQRLKQLVTLNTITDTKSYFTHHGTTTVQGNTNDYVQVPALSNPSIMDKILSVHAVVKHQGTIMFSATELLLLKRNNGILNMVLKLPWSKAAKGYIVTGTVPKTAQALKAAA